jgi:hypothetical protein
MIIKSADDKQAQQMQLQNLLLHPLADAGTKKRIEQELRNIQAGIRGEAEAAYEMQVHYGQSSKWMVLHDLRIEHQGLVAQIDHLVINRFLEIWVCESKHFSEGVAINEHGEFSAFFGSKPYGVPSPIEQNNRHILILKRAFDSGAVNLPKRLGFTLKPNLNSLVLIAQRARITRPKANILGLDTLIKNDMLFKTIDAALDDNNPLIMAKMIGSDALERLAREIAQLHKPLEFDWHAKFGLPQLPGRASPTAPPHRPVTQRAPPIPTPPAAAPAGLVAAPESAKQKLVCTSCAEPVPYNVAKFCWFNKPKFGGNIYCLECQKQV